MAAWWLARGLGARCSVIVEDVSKSRASESAVFLRLFIAVIAIRAAAISLKTVMADQRGVFFISELKKCCEWLARMEVRIEHQGTQAIEKSFVGCFY